MQQRVGHQLRDAQRGALEEIVPTDFRTDLVDPRAGVTNAAGSYAQREGWSVQGHTQVSRSGCDDVTGIDASGASRADLGFTPTARQRNVSLEHFFPAHSLV
ncbi:hypothetical protein GCM10027020_35640 [Nocardioides salsibiostraticola]